MQFSAKRSTVNELCHRALPQMKAGQAELVPSLSSIIHILNTIRFHSVIDYLVIGWLSSLMLPTDTMRLDITRASLLSGQQTHRMVCDQSSSTLGTGWSCGIHSPSDLLRSSHCALNLQFVSGGITDHSKCREEVRYSASTASKARFPWK